MTFSWFLPKWWKSDKNDKNTKKRQKWWFESHADLSLCDRCVNLIKTWKSDQNDKNDENMLQKLILITMYSSTFYKDDIFWKTQNRVHLLCQWQDKWPPKHGFRPVKNLSKVVLFELDQNAKNDCFLMNFHQNDKNERNVTFVTTLQIVYCGHILQNENDDIFMVFAKMMKIWQKWQKHEKTTKMMIWKSCWPITLWQVCKFDQNVKIWPKWQKWWKYAPKTHFDNHV